jgi:hypothetical protein
MMRHLFVGRFNILDAAAIACGVGYLNSGQWWLGIGVVVGIMMVSIAGERCFKVGRHG